MQKNSPITLSTRRFIRDDQQIFARLSGDINPIHVDNVAARRSLMGAVVVHGIHTFLWSLEALAKSEFKPMGLRAFDVRFPRPVYLGDEVTLTLQSSSPEELNLKATVGIKTVAIIRLDCLPAAEIQARRDLATIDCAPLVPAAAKPKEIALSTAPGKSGQIDFAATEKDFAGAFPEAARFIGAGRLRGIAACSRLVGMECPGLRSIFSRLSAAFTDRDKSSRLAYEVVETDDRFSIVRMCVAGAGLEGRIEAFSPPIPPEQPAIRDIAGMVETNEFAGQTALVIGGSRGLGELAAKTIAAGGGRVLITCAVGHADAARVIAEIRESGGQAEMFPYDITKDVDEQLARLKDVIPTHIYYFATCPIFRAKTELFDSDLLSRFMTFYVDGFYHLCRAFEKRGVKTLSIFYPSSVAVEDPPRDLAEYAMAKAAGEALCADLPRIMPGFRVLLRRLPRLLTDQTATITPRELPPAIDIILPIVRAMK